MPSSFFLLLATVVVLAFIGGILRSISGHTGAKGPGRSYSYGKKPYLFTRADRSFLGVLEQASDGRYRVFGKVRLADVLEPRSGMARGSRQSAFNKISSKHLDFVLCAPDDLSPVTAVELDDKSHQLPQRRARDHFLQAALGTAGLPLLRFPVQASYSVHEVGASLGTLPSPSSAPSLANGSPVAVFTPEEIGTHCASALGETRGASRPQGGENREQIPGMRELSEVPQYCGVV